MAHIVEMSFLLFYFPSIRLAYFAGTCE